MVLPVFPVFPNGAIQFRSGGESLADFADNSACADFEGHQSISSVDW
jgi:hypothetical protein